MEKLFLFIHKPWKMFSGKSSLVEHLNDNDLTNLVEFYAYCKYAA